MPSIPVPFSGWGLRTFSWRLSGRIVAVFSREERERAVELYFSTPMSTKQVVEHLGYPTRQCPGTVAARRSQVCGCRPQAAHTVGDAVSRGGIVPVGHAAEAGGDGAWHQHRRGASLDETVPRRRNGGAGDRNGGMPCRSPEPIASRWAMTRMCCVGGYAGWSRGNALMREVVRGRKKRPGRRPAAPVEPGEDDAGRPAGAEVFAEVADMLAAHRAQQLPLPPREARRRQVRRAARPRGAGIRRFQGPVRVPAGQGRARDGRLGEGDPQDHARGRIGRPCSRAAALQPVTGARSRPRRTTSSTGISPPNGPTRSGSRTSPRSRPATERCTSRR